MPELLNRAQGIQVGESGKRESSITFRMSSDTHSIEGNSMHGAS